MRSGSARGVAGIIGVREPRLEAGRGFFVGRDALVLLLRGKASLGASSPGEAAPDGMALEVGEGSLVLAMAGTGIVAVDEVSLIVMDLAGESEEFPLAGELCAEARRGTCAARLSPVAARRMADTARRLAREVLRRDPFWEEMSAALAGELLATVARILLGGRPRFAGEEGLRLPDAGAGSPKPWTMDEVIRYIDEHYAERFSLEYFVSKCATNPSDFSRRFKEKAGCPLFEYLNRRRIRRAAALLKEGEMTVIDIAFAVGYNNLSFFNRYFQRIMHATPSEYRLASRR